MPNPHFLYHSFPRRGDSVENGLAILERLARMGLLLVPEVVSWPAEFMPGGTRASELSAFQIRACFTYLNPSALEEHGARFGSFAIEFDIEVLRQMGALPVFYVPVASKDDGLAGLGHSLVARVADTSELLQRLQHFLDFANGAVQHGGADAIIRVVNDLGTGDLVFCTVPSGGPRHRVPKSVIEAAQSANPGFIAPTPGPGGVGTGMTAGALSSVLNILTWGIQSFDVQTNALRGMSGLFYPTERREKDPVLNYYQAHEWRILGNVAKDGIATSTPLTEVEAKELLDLDADFFGKELQSRTQRIRRVDACQVVRQAEGRAFLSHVRRIICPAAAYDRAREIVEAAGLSSAILVQSESLRSQ